MQPLVNPLPPAVAMLAMVIFGIEMILSAAGRGYIGGAEGIGWRVLAVRDYGFYTPVLEFLIERGLLFSVEQVRFVSYVFVHGNFTHAIFVIVFLLALGKLVGEIFGNFAVLAIFFLSAVFGALVYAGLAGDERPLIGGFPAVYGLIGAYTFILWTNLGLAGDNQWRAFTLIGFLLAFQLIFGVLFGSNSDWVAEIAGFAFGFLITPVFAPGGFRRLVERLRQR